MVGASAPVQDLWYNKVLTYNNYRILYLTIKHMPSYTIVYYHILSYAVEYYRVL